MFAIKRLKIKDKIVLARYTSSSCAGRDGQPYDNCITVSEQSVNNLSNCITCVGCCNFLHNPNFLTVAAKFKDSTEKRRDI